jgi:hypothetical protein
VFIISSFRLGFRIFLLVAVAFVIVAFVLILVVTAADSAAAT